MRTAVHASIKPQLQIVLKSFTSSPRLIYSCALLSLTGSAGLSGHILVSPKRRTSMPFISRRDLLCSGLALSASSMLARSAWARTAALLGDSFPTGSAEALAVAPREQLLFDFGWKFVFGHGSDPARDLNFGFGQGDFAKTGGFDFAKARFDD